MISLDPLAVDLSRLALPQHSAIGYPEQSSSLVAKEGGIRVVIWSCEPGEFPFTWTNAETFYIIEGAGTITDSEGIVEQILPGRVFFMSEGTSVRWQVTQTIKKLLVVPSILTD